MKTRISGVTRTITNGKVRVDGTLRPLTRIARHDGTSLVTVETFTPPLAVTASSPAYGSRVGAGSVTTASTTATPSGGIGPFSYAWARLSGFGTANSPAMATTTFTETVALEEFKSGVFRVTVTDSTGATATADVDAQFDSLPLSNN